MGAVTIVPDPARAIDPLAVSESVLAMTIAGVTLAILGASIIAAVMDQRIAQKNALLDTALNNMSHGVMMFDADSRVILCNQRYLDLYRLPAGAIKPGLTLREVIERRIAAGTFDGDPDIYCANVLGAVARRQASRQIIEQPDGRTIEVVGKPLADGGWVATHQDITEERRRQASFRFLFENNPLPMWVWDHETLRFLAVNKAAEEKYGYDRETFLTLTLHDIKRSPDWSSIESTISGDESGLREGQTTVHAKADGSLFDVAFYGRSMSYEGRAASLITLIDITKRKRAEDELRRTRAFLDTIVENMPAILTVKDTRDKRYMLVNRAAERAFGVPGAEMVGKRADEIFSKQTADFVDNSDREVAESGTLHAAEEQPFETPHNGVRLFNTKKLLVRGADSDAQYLLSLSEDVTDRKRARDQIAHMALHDTLTDLPNRAAFNDKLAATLAAAAQPNKTFAVLSIDLDRFKEVNDVFGHATGDTLLCEAGRRLREAAGGAFLARFGGDEFALIVADGAQLVAKRSPSGCCRRCRPISRRAIKACMWA